MNEDDEDRWWEQFSKRLEDEAHRRGGVAYVHEWAVNLAPPHRRGAFLHISRGDDGFARVECGFALKTMAAFTDFESANHSALSVVLSIVDGRTWEYADATADGTWVGTRYFIPLPDGSQGSETPRRRPGAEPIAQSFARRIPAWGQAEEVTAAPMDEEDNDRAVTDGGLRFLSLEEAVRLGVTDEDGNFLD